MTSSTMPMMEHLVEFRKRLVWSLIAVGIGTFIAFLFNEQILALLARPYEIAVPEGKLAFFRPTEAFATVMRLSLFGGVILASPVIFYQIWRFIAPALSPKEKRWAYPITAVFVVLFVTGVTVGYVALERGLGFLLGFGGDTLTPVIGADFYLKFATRFILAFGIAFEFPVFLFAAAAVGVVTSKRLRDDRRWAVLIIIVGAAIITPSGDPMTLMLLATPLYVLFELSILAIRFILKR
ncbi:MAG: twin-arginine translocase subunit TatC [Acidimicrobiia bacterium]|nr:MAG: twin-arginine translocase subunit TatC [Acidimicrobiia bacterium]